MHRAALGAIVAATALLLILEGTSLPAAWLPIEEAEALTRARGGAIADAPSTGVLYPGVLAPAARSLDPTAAHGFAIALSAVLWAAAAIPAYLLARRLVPPGAALAAAAIAVVTPGSIYGTAAVPDALAVLFAWCSLPLLARASERGSKRDLAAAVSLAAAAALTRPWFTVLPLALLVAYGLPRSGWRLLWRWPGSLALAALVGVGYLLLAEIAPNAALAFASPGSLAQAAAASLTVAAVGVGVAPWLLTPSGVRLLGRRPEALLLVTCLPALAVAAGVLGAATPVRGVDERPLLALVPLVLALAAVTWIEGGVRLRAAGAAGAILVLAALALPRLGPVPSARAAGLSVIAPDGGSRALLVAGVSVAVLVALLLLAMSRRLRILLPVVLALLLLVGQVSAWSSARDAARGLAAAERVERGWVDRHAGPGARVVLAGPPEALDEVSVAQLALWNRSVEGRVVLDVSYIDPTSGQLPGGTEADLVLARGIELAGTEVVARSTAGTLLREPQVPFRLAETIEGIHPDGWSGEQAIYRRHSGGHRPGTVVVSVSREGWPGGDPAHISVAAGPVDGVADELRGGTAIRGAGKDELEIRVPPPPFRVVVTVRPTFPSTDLGLADGRQLGARIRFVYRSG